MADLIFLHKNIFDCQIFFLDKSLRILFNIKKLIVKFLFERILKDGKSKRSKNIFIVAEELKVKR